MDIRREMQLAESLKTRNHQKIRQERSFCLLQVVLRIPPKTPMNRNDLFDPLKPPLRGCSKQNNPCLPAVGDYNIYIYK